MIQLNVLNVKWCNSQLNKLKFEIKNVTEVTESFIKFNWRF